MQELFYKPHRDVGDDYNLKADEECDDEIPTKRFRAPEKNFTYDAVPNKMMEVVVPALSSKSAISGPPPTALFMQQKFDGSFEINDALASLLFTTPTNIRASASSESRLKMLDTSTKEKVYCCVFVLAMLQKYWGSYESSWEMTADKAKQWMVSLLMKQMNVDKTNARKLVDELVAAVVV